MITAVYYFYTDQTKHIKDGHRDFMREHYTVIKVNIYNNCIDDAEHKARTINDQYGFGKMPGGLFNGTCQTYWDIYTVINCPDNTKIQPYTEHDKFIVNLIEYELSLKYILI